MNYQIFENAFWWQSEKDQAHEGIHEFINVLRDEQDGFYSNTGVNLGLYNGRPNRNREGSMGYYSSANQPRLTFNIIHSICQAAKKIATTTTTVVPANKAIVPYINFAIVTSLMNHKQQYSYRA